MNAKLLPSLTLAAGIGIGVLVTKGVDNSQSKTEADPPTAPGTIVANWVANDQAAALEWVEGLGTICRITFPQTLRNYGSTGSPCSELPPTSSFSAPSASPPRT